MNLKYLRRQIRVLKNNNHASVDPVMVFLGILAFTSLLVLILGIVLEPFMNLVDSDDDEIAAGIKAPRTFVNQFFQLFWPKGLLLAVFILSSAALFIEYQKLKYRQPR